MINITRAVETIRCIVKQIKVSLDNIVNIKDAFGNDINP